MSPIKVTISGTGTGGYALTGREADGVTVAFENEPAAFLSWKAFRQLLSMKAARREAAEQAANAPAVAK